MGWTGAVGAGCREATCSARCATSSARRRTVVVATGILNIWMHGAEETAAEHARLTADHGDRLFIGLGVSHRPLIDRMNEPGTYRQPLATDGGVPRRAGRGRPSAPDGPAGARRAGAEDARAGAGAVGRHPPLPRDAVAHATGARGARARPAGRARAGRGARLRSRRRPARPPGSTSPATWSCRTTSTTGGGSVSRTRISLDGGSDRLVDALVAWGDESAIAARVQEHRDAGADHVCVQVLTDEPAELPLREWRALAPVGDARRRGRGPVSPGSSPPSARGSGRS